MFNLNGEAIAAIVRIIEYPGEGYALPFGFPFELKAKTGGPDPAKIHGKIDGVDVGTGGTIPVSGLSAGIDDLLPRFYLSFLSVSFLSVAEL